MLYNDKTFTDVVENIGLKNIFLNTPAYKDDATQAVLLEWFFDYKLGTDDQETFLRYFRRRINQLYPRYIHQVRIYTVTSNMDPFIQHYFEKQDRVTNNTSETGTATKNGTGTQTTTGTGSGTRAQTRTPNLEENVTENSTETGTASGTSETNETPNLTNTKTKTGTEGRTSNGSRTEEGTTGTTTSGSESVTETENGKSKNFAIAYPEANMSSLPTGIDDTPESIDYVSNGAYNVSKRTNNTGTTTSGTEDGEHETSVTETGSETTTYNTTDAERQTGTRQVTGTTSDSTQDTHAGTTRRTNTGTETVSETTQKTDSTEVENSTSDTENKTAEREETHSLDGREQGRDESPADILPRAIAAIQSCDPVKWFIDSMSICFDCFSY